MISCDFLSSLMNKKTNESKTEVELHLKDDVETARSQLPISETQI